ncbi:zinc metalloproteinase nas-1-like [Drosophila biarmipes]|uniref:zinc metalloproteinase nas-1-like n=1 Tax=Drosophila biarmipes TaxID=125945 RepID=UPI0007E7F3E0|nr:zinc metalloproteinase nas-1-like [Drosophila biarmipes]
MLMFLVLLCISLGDAMPFGNPNGESRKNPWELGSHFEGDIVMPMGYRFARNGLVPQRFHWPGAVVPYEIEGAFTREELETLNNAFKEYHNRTCVRFRPRIKEKDYIAIVNKGIGCYSNPGRVGGRQEVNYQTPECMIQFGTVLHELMHAVGFYHEHNRYERDSYVRVVYANIAPFAKPNFWRYHNSSLQGFGVDYDFASVTHYPQVSFSVNGEPTIVPLRDTPESRMMGQREGFSVGDVRKINAMYKCKRSKSGKRRKVRIKFKLVY